MKNRSVSFDLMFLLAIAALAYLPLIHQIGFTYDDWYLMYSAGAQGADVFHEIYSGIRPLRAFVMEPAYVLFGQNVLLYNLSAWGFRVLSAWLFFWLLKMIWPHHPRLTLLMAMLFLIYPGFLGQYNGIDYQSQILSLALVMLSLVLTVHAYFQKHPLYKTLEIIFAILLGYLYLGLVEYEAGFELMRLAILALLAWRAKGNTSDRILATCKAWIPNSVILLGFGFWRAFLFESERKARDVSSQLENFWLYPIQTAYGWLIQVAQDFFDVTLSAYVIPLSQLTDHIQRWGGILAIIVVSLTIYFFNKMQTDDDQIDVSPDQVMREALILGLVTAIGGLILIAMVNREVYFPSFSRYALTSSAGVAILIAALLMQINKKILYNALLGVLFLISMLTHHANAVKHAQDTARINEFWWQVSWRVPQFEKNTTLIANYLSVATEEDYFIWGPANLIYYPESQNAEVLQPALFAEVLNQTTVQKILTKERQEYDNRLGIITYKNFRNILVLSQPSLNSCVHVINGLQSEFSNAESVSIRLIGSYSEVEHVLVDETPHVPPEIVFGSEPAHDWCYYYQKADLARQRGEWSQVLDMGEQARGQGLEPSDLIEWMPFLQAYAQAGDVDRLKDLAPEISADQYVALQACRIFGTMPGIASSVAAVIDSQYCLE